MSYKIPNLFLWRLEIICDFPFMVCRQIRVNIKYGRKLNICKAISSSLKTTWWDFKVANTAHDHYNRILNEIEERLNGPLDNY